MEKQIYTIDVDYKYGPVEIYHIEATSAAEARKKAKDKYAKAYFSKKYMRTFIYE